MNNKYFIRSFVSQYAINCRLAKSLHISVRTPQCMSVCFSQVISLKKKSQISVYDTTFTVFLSISKSAVNVSSPTQDYLREQNNK